MRTRLTELLGIRLPVVQGGLAHLAFAGLATAVSNAGGLGQITAASFARSEELRAEIQKARAATHKPFGVNFALGHWDWSSHLDVALEEKVPVISVTGGNPEPLFQRLHGHQVKKLVLVAGVRQAQKAEDLGADAVIAVGAEGGGHLGRDDTSTLVLVARIVDSVRVPVIASGGIGDGRGLAAALALGAEGIEMGTRFVATRECVAHPAYKEGLVRARETDTVIIERSLGRPGRALRSPFTEEILRREAEGATFDDLLPFIGAEANRRAALQGKMDEGFAWAGQVAGLVEDIPTVAELLSRLVTEARESWRRLGQAMEP
ncbi:MAG: nitronate monooxygenase [Firmicutes bacterium]|nr:nitronate monooxygenase [Bacillota bacterium]